MIGLRAGTGEDNGQSDEPSTSYSSVDDLARVIAFLSASPAIPIGCSFGSLLSLLCAAENPGLVVALVLASPIVTGSASLSPLLALCMKVCRAGS
jgi:pimeloyl-ACP methyl ester carboxylesterase